MSPLSFFHGTWIRLHLIVILRLMHYSNLFSMILEIILADFDFLGVFSSVTAYISQVLPFKGNFVIGLYKYFVNVNSAAYLPLRHCLYCCSYVTVLCHHVKNLVNQWNWSENLYVADYILADFDFKISNKISQTSTMPSSLHI